MKVQHSSDSKDVESVQILQTVAVALMLLPSVEQVMCISLSKG